MTLTLQEAIARVPQWAGARDLKATPLAGGITNHNFRIDVGGESFVLRIAGADTELLGIHRDWEYEANLIAGKAGIAPEVYYIIRPEGYLVTRFVFGQIIPPEQMRQPENIQRVVETVKQIHSLPAIPGTFNPFRVIREYAQIAHRYRVTFPKDFDHLIERVNDAEKALAIRADKPCPCHNDLLNANFLSNDQLIILDWEYAGMGDGYFDLANFSDHHDLTDELDRWMLECYVGPKFKQDQWAHLKIMKPISDLREATWGLVQIGISKLDFDFREYAERFFGRVTESIYHPSWSKYLMEVSEDV